MRPALIEILKCLKCGTDDLRLVVKNKDNVEITQGLITCRKCGLSYFIKDGILNCLEFSDPLVLAARKVYKKSKEILDKSNISPQQLAKREHLESNYRHDTEANYRELLLRLGAGQGWALDIGAGTCWTTAGLAGRGYRAVAIDISADNKLELGRQHFNQDIYFDRVLADVNHLPFRQEAFSLAFASAALHHSRDLALSLSQISRTMKSQGRLEIINEPVRGLAEAFQRNTGRLEGPEDVIEKHYGIRTWMKTLERAGFAGRYLFPDNIRQRLATGGFTSSNKFYYLAGLIAKLYKFPWVKFILERVLFYFGMYLFGLPLIYTGEKTSANQNLAGYNDEK
ncbi:MAG: methyltransferase domain-containing protein [Candidatus Edwardsbacteria bacterium]|nr:methyltransferase domain-containing protein [Candidatus Edwardsbacteria bacterium]MBU1577014.1 methyltransferase domain-containing protein [Candidatus Edwardsbacteria bacterium]MBU2464568.1 methyltransferase domain-containing protein [Candidatus Edwardsbacteria bacterium]MBU2593431.1 methyltransferase domain-containing protein [Candidatus Edwardsbacteria bacterium]